MSQVAITLDSDTLALLDASAQFRSISREDMLRQAILETAEYDRYYRESVEAGLRDVEAGRVISNEEMRAEMAALFQEINTADKLA